MPITPVDIDDTESNADDTQFDDGYDDIVDEVMDSAQEEVQQAATIDSRMAEMEERLEMIQYYKLLLNGGFFNNPPNQSVASKIEQEVAEFVLGRLDTLLNMGSGPAKTKVESQFTDEEVANLKSLAEANTHKILTDVVSKVFAKIEGGIKKAPAKAEPPKLATKTVPAAPAPKKAAPSVMTVKARPMTNRAPAAAQPKPEAKPEAPKPQEPKKPGPQKKQFKTVARINQKTGEPEGTAKVDITPQARPLGPIQPVPPPTSKLEIESQLDASSRRQSNMGLNIFDQKLNQ